MSRLQITLIKSTVGQNPAKRATIRSLGLKKIDSVVKHETNPAILGMVESVSHLVKTEEWNNV